MKKLLPFIILIFALSLLGQNESQQHFEQLAMAEDSTGQKVLFNYIPARGHYSRYIYRHNSRLLLIDDKSARIYNSSTLDLIADFKAKDGAVIGMFNDSGYVVGVDNFFTSTVKPTYYNFEGKKLWQGKYNASIYVSPLNVVVCCKSSGKEYIAYDIITGKELWRRDIINKNHSFVCGPIFDKDSVRQVYLIADSLMRLDCLTGEAIVRPFRTYGDKSFFNVVPFVPHRAPVSSGFRNEMYASYGNAHVPTGLHSNCIMRGDSLIIADADSIYCFDRNLGSIWSTALPEGSGSKSIIRVSGDRIYMLNFGTAFADGRMLNYGKPFAAKYSLSNGEQISVTFPKTDWLSMGGRYTDDGRIYLQTVKGFYTCMEGDSIVEKIKWKVRSDHEPIKDRPKFVLYNTVYLLKEGRLEPVVTDRNKMVVEVYERDVNIVSIDGTCQHLPADEVYFHDMKDVYSTNNGRDSRNHFVVLDSGTNKVKYKFRHKGTVLQDADGNIIVETPGGVGILPKK